MTEPNLDEFINQCKDKCYLTNGRNASNDLEGDFGTWEDWKLAIGEFIANQVREALEDVYEEQKKWSHEHAELKLGYATYMLTIVKDRIKELGE